MQLNQALLFTSYQDSQWYFPKARLALWSTPVTALAITVLNAKTGKSLEYFQLQHHPKYQKNWEESYCNELLRLCQFIGTGEKGIKKQQVAVTETFRVIKYEDVPADRIKEVTYTKLVCEVRPHKNNPNRTRITIGGNIIIYPGDVATPIDSLKLTNIIINSVLFRHGAIFFCFDVKKFIFPYQWTDQNIPKSRLLISRLDLLMNKTYKPSIKTDGYILKLSEVAMAYPRVVS